MSHKLGQLEQGVEKLALDHMNSGNKTTHLVINKLLSNQGVSVSETKLQDLLIVKGVEFYLLITKESYDQFASLVGKSSYTGFAGVYVFTHKVSNSKYVGSSSKTRVLNDVVKSTIFKVNILLEVNFYLFYIKKV